MPLLVKRKPAGSLNDEGRVTFSDSFMATGKISAPRRTGYGKPIAHQLY